LTDPFPFRRKNDEFAVAQGNGTVYFFILTFTIVQRPHERGRKNSGKFKNTPQNFPSFTRKFCLASNTKRRDFPADGLAGGGRFSKRQFGKIAVRSRQDSRLLQRLIKLMASLCGDNPHGAGGPTARA
jgi:hypothetical protein